MMSKILSSLDNVLLKIWKLYSEMTTEGENDFFKLVMFAVDVKSTQMMRGYQWELIAPTTIQRLVTTITTTYTDATITTIATGITTNNITITVTTTVTTSTINTTPTITITTVTIHRHGKRDATSGKAFVQLFIDETVDHLSQQSGSNCHHCVL